ncbi:hypothetical protein ACWDBD_19460 [Streptomyces sp. NPDC001118]
MSDGLASGPASEPVRCTELDDLDVLSAPRRLTADDHMFTVEMPSGFLVTCRLQLFTGAGVRPVAVATQIPGDGLDVTSAAEWLAGAVWERHCPEEELPPVWIHLKLMRAGKLGPMGIRHGQFTQTDRYWPQGPLFTTITHERLQALVGVPVAMDRGTGYVPRPEEAEERRAFEKFAVVRFARPEPFRAQVCMPAGVPWWLRWARQVLPRRGARSCCWYHGGDWHAVSAMALQVLKRARTQCVNLEDMEEFAVAHAVAAGATDWETEALATLFDTADAIQPDRERRYINGQHRAQAMLEAGVRRTVVLRTVGR